MTDLHDEIPREFLFMGQNMEKVTVFYGFFLAAWGVGVSSISGSESITSLIPSIIGLPLIVLGISSLLFPKLKKLLMHIAVLIGLIAFLGGSDFFRGIGSDGGAFSNPWAGASKLMLFTTGLIFTILSVRSFIFARKNREATSVEEEKT
tara:strand:+ start:323 stop:769 length:447 start_codon:yes stop_codon:yes gene_type:complete